MRLVSVFVVAACCLVGTSSGGQSSLTTNGSAALLKPSDKKNIKAASFRVLAPTYVPSGFKLNECEIGMDDDKLQRSYTLHYKKGKAFFMVQMVSDGIGDPMFDLPNGETVEADGSMKGKSIIFGDYMLDYVRRKDLQMWHTTWYQANKVAVPRYVMVYGENVSPEIGKRIVESLRWLK